MRLTGFRQAAMFSNGGRRYGFFLSSFSLSSREDISSLFSLIAEGFRGFLFQIAFFLSAMRFLLFLISLSLFIAAFIFNISLAADFADYIVVFSRFDIFSFFFHTVRRYAACFAYALHERIHTATDTCRARCHATDPT